MNGPIHRPENRRRPHPARATARRLAALLAPGCASAIVLAGIACRSLRPIAVRPVPAEATELFVEAEALDALDARGPDAAATRARARELAEAARASAPDWLAPRRLLDDLLRAELRGVEALEAHREKLSQGGPDAGELYLAGRLEGIDGEARFARAADLDPGLAWTRHGLAVSAERRADWRTAVAEARAAAARARDPWERSFFASSLARILARSGRKDDAVSVLGHRLDDEDVVPDDARALGAQLAEIALESKSASTRLAAFRRGIDLLLDEDLADAEVDSLGEALRTAAGREASDLVELSNALATKRTPARDRLRAEVLLTSSSTPLALGLLERSLGEEGTLEISAPLMRAARFAAGDFASGVELWLADLPSAVVGPDGLPRDEALARVVRIARSLGAQAPEPASATRWFEFGDALLAAGWYREARSLAGALARADFERALDLETRAGAGVALLDELDDLIRGADAALPPRIAGPRADRDGGAGAGARGRPPSGASRGPRDLTEMLADIGPIFAHARSLLGDRDPAELSRAIAASPRLQYGLAGAVVHPGPVFSRADERAGLGQAGDPVPGLAQAMASIHRFALLGELSGAGGPDGTVLASVHEEEKSGEHLGVPWGGWVAWCEGADVKSREVRRGARISAAALHEGYWLDIDSVRAERVQFAGLRAQFSGDGASERIERALAVRGFAVQDSGDEDRVRRDRTRIGSALGESSRVRLAVLRDRGAPLREPDDPGRDTDLLGRVDLDELAAITAVHEEGHLTDRTRYLPISEHWGAALLFLLDCGFSPVRVAERLEYRAELVALADSGDPRIPLAQILDAAESGGLGPTAHAGGYQELLRDLLEVLDERITRDPRAFPEIDRGRTLVHQLHRLAPGDVRALARGLAEKRRLVR